MNGCMASLLAPVAPGAPPSPACPSKTKAASAAISRRRRAVSCKATGGGRDDDDGLLWRLPRRDMLSALTGVGLAAGYQGLASAAVIEPCLRGDKVDGALLDCTAKTAAGLPCPPRPHTPAVDFTPERAVKRVRQPIHLLSREDRDKYREAVARMKALPAENPLSFAAQAAIHQAYCDSHYKYDPKNKDVPFDVHFSWLFAPWHRMYIYFYERALGQLIGDDTFALPYWNWDTPAGMVVPALFRDSFANPLHNKNREPKRVDKLLHLDLDFFEKPELIPFDAPQDAKYKEAVNKNLCTVYQQQIREGTCARAFLGEKLCSRLTDNELGDKTGCQGTLERMAHTAVHAWVGGDESSFLGHDGKDHTGADMGFLGSAGRDPLFYSHHANVDRMWHLWSTKLGGGNGFPDPEWLDASFDFYDDVENPRLVRIKFRDVLDTRSLGYTYAETDKELPWLKCNLTSLVPKGGKAPPSPGKMKPAAPVFPVTLRKGQVVEVPAVAVPAKQAGQERVLVIQSFEYDPCEKNKFDVAINVPKDKAADVGPQHYEYAGCFAVVPSSNDGGGAFVGKLALPIDAVLADVLGQGETTVDVIIVPRTAAEIKINVAPTIENQKK